MVADARHRIQAVAEMTGVPAATLRAWERRYGFPAPHRTTSAYRLYSDHDVELVRRMGALVAAGVPPSEAARRLAGTELVDDRLDEEDPYAGMVARIGAAVRALDAPALKGELRRLVLLDDGAAAFTRVLKPALADIGTMWEAGEISVAHEHFASHLISSSILDLLRTTPVPPGAATVILACFAEELHSLPLLGLSLEVVGWGYRPFMLGARTPPEALGSAVSSLRPALVGLSATISPGSPAVCRKLIDEYAEACGDTPWVVGGAAAQSLAALVTARGGHVTPPDPGQARALFDRLTTQRPARPGRGSTKLGS